MRARLIYKSILNQRPHRAEAIPPRDLFAFAEIAAIVRNWHFIQLVSALEDFRRDLRLEIEAVRFDLKTFDDIGAKHFVARFHVGQDRVVQNVCQ